MKGPAFDDHDELSDLWTPTRRRRLHGRIERLPRLRTHAYREYKEEGNAIPLLTFLYQKLDAASDPQLEAFNRAIYAAINADTDIKSAMAEYSPTD